jgi:hypothetical protein
VDKLANKGECVVLVSFSYRWFCWWIGCEVSTAVIELSRALMAILIFSDLSGYFSRTFPQIFNNFSQFPSSRIQESDGGFFERFGSVLHARNEDNIDRFKARQISVDGEVAKIIEPDEAVPFAESRMGAIEEDDDKGKDSGNESIDTDSDAEDKTQSIKAIQNAMVGMNVSREFSRIFRAFHGHRRAG